MDPECIDICQQCIVHYILYAVEFNQTQAILLFRLRLLFPWNCHHLHSSLLDSRISMASRLPSTLSMLRPSRAASALRSSAALSTSSKSSILLPGSKSPTSAAKLQGQRNALYMVGSDGQGKRFASTDNGEIQVSWIPRPKKEGKKEIQLDLVRTASIGAVPWGGSTCVSYRSRARFAMRDVTMSSSRHTE